MPNPVAAWWISAGPVAAALPGAPALAERVPPAAWPAQDPAARAELAARLAVDPGRPFAAVDRPVAGAADGRGSRRLDPPTAAIHSSRTRGSSVAGWCW